MRGNHRLGRYRQRVVERLVGNVGNIDDHAEPVHLPHHFLAKLGQAIVARFVGGRVRPIVVAEMDQRHGANPEPVEHAEHAQIVGDRVAALDRQQSGDPAGLVDSEDVGRVVSQFDLVRICVQHTLHRVPELQDAPHGLGPCVVRGHVERKVRSEHAAFTQAREIDVVHRMPLREVGVLVDHPLKCVDVAVDPDRFLMDLPGSLQIISERRRSSCTAGSRLTNASFLFPPTSQGNHSRPDNSRLRCPLSH